MFWRSPWPHYWENVDESPYIFHLQVHIHYLGEESTHHETRYRVVSIPFSFDTILSNVCSILVSLLLRGRLLPSPRTWLATLWSFSSIFSALCFESASCASVVWGDTSLSASGSFSVTLIIGWVYGWEYVYFRIESPMAWRSEWPTERIVAEVQPSFLVWQNWNFQLNGSSELLTNHPDR